MFRKGPRYLVNLDQEDVRMLEELDSSIAQGPLGRKSYSAILAMGLIALYYQYPAIERKLKEVRNL